MPVSSSSSCRRMLSLLLSGMLALPAVVWAQEDERESIAGATTIVAEQIIAEAEEHPDLVMIDARLPGDRHQGYIEGSVSLPDTETTCQSLAKVIPRFNTPALFYCNGIKCPRSENAISVALRCGYQKIYWFRGGFSEWKAKDFPYLRVIN